MAKTIYAVFALKRAQVATVRDEIRSLGLKNVSDWLERMGRQLYGDTNDDWKPFNTQTIKQILATSGSTFHSSTALIDTITDDMTNVGALYNSGISLYIVDVFSLFLKKYKELAVRLDSDAAKSGRVCLVLQTILSSEFDLIQSKLVQAYFGQWPQVRQAYARGSGHRIVLTPEDMANFREYLAGLNADGPDPRAINFLKGVWGDPDTRVPRIGGS